MVEIPVKSHSFLALHSPTERNPRQHVPSSSPSDDTDTTQSQKYEQLSTNDTRLRTRRRNTFPAPLSEQHWRTEDSSARPSEPGNTGWLRRPDWLIVGWQVNRVTARVCSGYLGDTDRWLQHLKTWDNEEHRGTAKSEKHVIDWENWDSLTSWQICWTNQIRHVDF